MPKVLITGATGNVGMAIIEALGRLDHSLEIYAGVRDLKKDIQKLSPYKIGYSLFDFTDVASYQEALRGCDILFLLRPPQISDVEKYFRPIVQTCIQAEVKHIVFLSVQGVEKTKIIPHHKIEKMILESKIPYTFLRPAYFMQNFTTTLRDDLIKKKRIYLPAGSSKFTVIDVKDIGAVAANMLTNISSHINKSYALTNKEKLSFTVMAKTLSQLLGTPIQYTSPNLLSFFLTKRKEKLTAGFILVMIMLHYFPRFQKEPDTTDWVEKLTHQQPTTFAQFIVENKHMLTSQ